MTGRLLVPSTTPPEASELAGAAYPDMVVVTVPVVGLAPVCDARESDLVVLPVPDVLGRILQPPVDARLVVVIDDIVGSTVRIGPDHVVLRYGEFLGDPARIRGAVAHLAKELAQRPGARAACDPTPPYRAPFLAPDGLGSVPAWCRTRRPVVPGLPDLVVVEVASRPPDGRRIEAPSLVVR